MKPGVFFSLIGCVAILLGCGGGSHDAPASDDVQVAEVTEAAAPERHDLVWVCGCGDECECGAVAVEPGTCSCGTELVQVHLVKVEGNEGLLCTCGTGCACTMDADDSSKCSCGTAVRRVSFEGSGIHFCNCGGGSCTCNHAAAAAGRCACGMGLSFAG